MTNKYIMNGQFPPKNIKRRDFLKLLVMTVIGSGTASDVLAKTVYEYTVSKPAPLDDHIRDYLYKMKHFDAPHKDDIWIDRADYHTFKLLVKRLNRLQELVGHGRFHILGFDDALRYASIYSDIGRFTMEELDLMEKFFYRDASEYGFYGEKTLVRLSDRINESDVIYMSRHGNYLYKGASMETYNRIRRQAGDNVLLTSGVRGVMKQFLLFLNKAYKNQGNLSLASRSLAPPGYSFHANGDFDVGQAGFGALNFTDKFTTTDAYQRLCDLGYLKLRYELENPFGVRFEPWHIRITV